jgi:adenine-specific DNA-methyltransferase
MYEKGKGAPPQTERTVTERPYSVVGSCPRGWKPLYRGADVSRFSLKAPNEFVHYGRWLAAPRNAELFQSPKIVMRRTDDRLMSAIEDDSAICVNSCHVIKFRLASKLKISYEFLVGILNTRLTQYFFETSNPQMVGKVFAEIKVIYVERLPVPKCSPEQQEQISELVKRVIAAKKGKPHSDTSKVEREIDERVYHLYGLTPDEIRLVEESVPSSSRHMEPTP